MDELEFRRTIYADPHTQDPQVAEATSEDPKRQAFRQEVESLDHDIQNAINIDLPEDLAERLIWRQTMQQHQRQRRRHRWHIAVAASVAFFMGIVVTFWQGPNTTNLGEHALAHIRHETSVLTMNERVTPEQANAKLATFGGQFSQDVGSLYFANFCTFEGLTSLHLVMPAADGERVTVFIVPSSDDRKAPGQFSDGQYKGQSLQFRTAEVMVVGEKPEAIDEVQQKVRRSLSFRT